VDPADRAVGCVLGLALGDALGAPFEFKRAKDIPKPVPVLTLPWMGLPAGSTTDDTAMARNLVRSLAASAGRLDADDLILRHLEWLRSHPPDVGNQTRQVLTRADGQVAAGAAPAEAALDAARHVWEERGPEVSAGNGSVMYCAPLGAAYAAHPASFDALEEAALTLSRLTHADERCQTAVLAVCLATAALVRGWGADAAIDLAVDHVIARDGGEELEFLIGEAGRSRPVDGPDQGFCLFAAAVGLQGLLAAPDFGMVLTRVVSLGGDTDTNGAVAGALLGAAVGATGLPPDWLRRLRDRKGIENEAGTLAAHLPKT
jgi:ADP-ribosyl-[dinitrogen reductase] hydrolase